MKLGAEPRKVAALAVLLVVAAYSIYTNLLAPSPAPASRGAAPPRPAPPAPLNRGALAVAQQAQAPAPPKSAQPPRRIARDNVQEWTPSLKPRRAEDRPDPKTVDPTLRLDLLAKLASVTYAGAGERSLFDFSAAPPPRVPDIKILPKSGSPRAPEPVAPPEPPPTTTAAPAEPPKPTAPPVPFKFYGFISNRDGRRGFFLNGDEIFTASEGQLLQSRYKIVRIGLNSAVISDTRFEGHQQTVPLEEPPPGS